MAQLLCGNDGDLLCIRFLARCRLDLCRMGNCQRLFRLHSELDETQGKAFPGACRLSAYRIGRCGCAGTILRQGWGFVKGNGRCTVLLLIGLFICWFLPNSKTMQEKFRPTWKSALYAAILLIACITQMNQVVQFLYFQF